LLLIRTTIYDGLVREDIKTTSKEARVERLTVIVYFRYLPTKKAD